MTDAEDRDIAENEFLRAVPCDSEPVLASDEVDAILDNNKRARRWTAGTSLTLGLQVIPSTRMGRIFEVIVQGTTGSTEPTWPISVDAEVVSGSATLREAGRDFASVYDVRAAIQEGWLLKASKAAEALSKDGEATIFEHCNRMVERYAVPLIA